MKRPRVAINGFGRIGRIVFRANLERELVDIVAVNDLSPTETNVHLLQYDSSYGPLDAKISVEKDGFAVNGTKTKTFCERDPSSLPWEELDIDIVLECTGVFRDRASAGKHLSAGARRVIVSAPGEDMDKTVVMGVNDDTLTADDKMLSNASCTTNCLAPIVKVLHESFCIEKGLLTTCHAYTNDQATLDQSHKDLRRARAAALSMIPTSTGAAEAVGKVIPELNGKLTGLAIRVPTPVVSVVDFVATLKNPPANAQAVNMVLQKAAAGPLKNILAIEDAPLVSIDFKKNPHSSIVDSQLTILLENMVKIIAWYDNEWAYSLRLLELCKKLASL